MSYLKTALLALFMAAGAHAQAAVVSYTLDQSSASGAAGNYATLTLSETTGQLEIRVESLVVDPSTGDFADIRSFELNVTDKTLDISNIVLPDGWKAMPGNPRDEFNIQLSAKGNARLDSLTFSIPGVTLQDIQPGFSMQLWGIVASGNTYFTGSSQAFNDVVVNPGNSAVPVPAAAWLFSSGLLGLLSVARHRKG